MYSAWGHLASRPDITLEWRVLTGALGLYVHQARLIVLDPRMPRRQARSVLAHELAHAEARDECTPNGRVNLRQEQQADRVAARRLIRLDSLGDAMVLHGEHLSATAVELGVSDALLGVRIKGLHPSERHALTRRLADA